MATFPVDIVVSTPGAQQLSPLNRQLDQTDRAASGAATAVRALAAAAAAIGVGSAVKNAINVNREFNKSISELSAITGATDRDLKFLTEASKEFGATTTLSASQAATAFKLIASAKPDLLSNVEALKAVTKEAITLSEATGQDLPTAAKALGSALNQFQLDASQASQVINILAASSQLGTSAVAQTTEALRNAGATANALKVDLAETVAAIQAFAKGGLEGAAAGTALNQVMLRLERTGDKALQPSVAGLSNSLDELARRNLGNTELMKLFGDEAFKSATIILGQRDALNELNTTIRGTNTAYEQAATNVDNLNGDLLALASAFEGVQIEAASLADGGLRDITQALTAGLQGLNENPERIADALETVGVAATAVAAVLAGRVVSGAAAATSAFVTKTTATLAAAQAEKDLAVTEAAAAAARAENAAITAATNKKLAAENAARLRSSLAAIDAEISLEKTRSSAQISERGRIDSATRFAEISKARVALSGQLAAADALVTKTTAEASAANVAATTSTIALSGAQRAATGTSAALGLAMAGLRNTMAFLGGPVGVILLAATALTVYKSNSDSAKNATDALNISLERLSRNQAVQALNEVNDEIGRLESQLTDRAEAIAEMQEALQLGSAVTGADDTAIARRIDEERAALDSTTQSLEAYRSKQQELKDEISGVNAALDRLGPSTVKTATATETAASNVLSLSESYGKVSAELATQIALTQQSAREAAITAATSKLTIDATEQERQATAALAGTLFDLSEQRKNTDATEQQRASIDQQVAALARQLVALQLTGEEQAVYNATSGLAAEATDAQRQQIEALTAAIYQRQEALRAEQAVQQFDQSTESPVERIEREAEEVRQANLLAYEQGLQDLTAYKEREVAITQKAEADKTKAVEESSKGRIAAEKQALSQALSLTSNVFGSIADVIADAKGKESKAYKVAFLASKAAAIAQAVIQTESAAIAALALPPIGLGPVAGVPYAGVIRGLGYASIGIMAGQAISGFKDGGDVIGPGTGRSDSILAYLSNGEKVMTAQRTAQYRSELSAMERGTFNANSGSAGAPRVTIINNVSDMATTTVTEGADGELIATIDRRIAEQTPGIVEQQIADPYSGTTRALNSTYRLERN